MDEPLELVGAIVIGRLKKDEVVTYAIVTNGQLPVFSKVVICSANDGWETLDLQAHAEVFEETSELKLQVLASQLFAETVDPTLLERFCRQLGFDSSEHQFALLPHSQLSRWFTRMVDDINEIGTFKLVGTEPKLVIQLNAPYSEILRDCQEAKNGRRKTKAA